MQSTNDFREDGVVSEKSSEPRFRGYQTKMTEKITYIQIYHAIIILKISIL